MTSVLATVSVVPLLAAPSLRAEQVSQLVLGEGATVHALDGEMLQVTTALDSHEGWLHRGYVLEVGDGALDRWLGTAGWSEGALLEAGGVALRAPHRARLPLEGTARVRLPDGRPASSRSGSVRPWGEVIREASAESPAEWAWREFAGSPYLWGGVTASGIDCSGLVQVTFLARGIPLPRDAHQQATLGEPVDPAQIAEGDLLYFRGAQDDRIGHVAIAATPGTMVHATVDVGRVIREPWTDGSRAAPLRERLVSVRRLG